MKNTKKKLNGKSRVVKASMPHPKGRISVKYESGKKGLKATINLPEGLNGTFKYKGRTTSLTKGEKVLNFKN